MRRKRRLLGIMLIITALIIVQLPAAEADAAASVTDFKIEDAKLVRYAGTEKKVTVPNTVEVIGEGAFEENDFIEEVILPDSVTRIEAFAFWGCDSLDTVTLGKGLTAVGDYAFANCKGLKRMTIPKNVRSIGVQAFMDCVNMTNITIPPETTSIHDTAFDGCYRLVIHSEAGSAADRFAKEFAEKQQEMPEYEDVPDYQPDNNTGNDDTDNNTNNNGNNGTDSNNGNGNGNGTIPAGSLLGATMVVGNQAVVFIDNTRPAMQGAGLPGGPELSPEDQQILEDMYISGEGGFAKFTVVDNTLVADQAYYRKNNLGSVTLPPGIKEIGQFSYARSSLTEITVPEGVDTISYGAFYHCDSLGSVSLPSTLVSIEPKAFAYTAWVQQFLAGSGMDANGDLADDFLISGGSLVAYRGDTAQVVIPEGVTLIAGEAFKGHTEIENVVFPNGLRVVGEGAFEGCSGLKTLAMNNEALTDIKDRAFAGCAIERVTLPASLERLGTGAFENSVMINYQGSLPETTHETSAERLSNESYRAPRAAEAAHGVNFDTAKVVSAQLEGAGRLYTLTLTEVGDPSVVEQAFFRNGRMAVPDDIVLFGLTLSDSSGIPINKLGRQMLTVTIPTPAALAGEGIHMVTLDRNGQMEQVDAERVKVDGTDCIQFSVNRLSLFGLYGDGIPLDAGGILEVSTEITSMAAAPGAGTGKAGAAGESGTGSPASPGSSIGLGSSLKLGGPAGIGGSIGPVRYQWILGGILLIAGLACFFGRGRAVR